MSKVENNDQAVSPPLGAGGRDLLLYNITTQVAWNIHEAWLAWMLDIYIPEILGTGCFIKHQVVRLLETDETDGPVYAVQYYILNMDLYKEYLTLYEPAFKKQEQDKWGNKIFSFSSLMQVVH